MTTRTTVVFWRHGRTAWNAENRFQGTSDIDLDQVGVAQSHRAAAVLETLQPDLIVSSPLRRAHATASALADRLGLPVDIDADLRETYAGTWEGLTGTEIRAVDATTFAAWISGEDVRAGGGENRTGVAKRVHTAVERHVARVHDGATVVVVTHGGATRAGLSSLLALPVDHWAALGGLVNCGWSVLERAEPDASRRWRLLEHNARSLPEEAVGDDT